MAFIKEFREFFLRDTKETGGSKPDQEVGFPTEYTVKGESKFNRFLKGNFPNQAVFEKFLESITFKLNPEDKATETEQGLVKTATEQKAFDRDNSDVDSLTSVVKPSQLSNVTDDSAGDDSITVVKSLVGGAAQFTVALSTLFKDKIAANALLHTQKPYIYFAAADDKDGNGFTLDMAQIYDSGSSMLMKPFFALLSTAIYKVAPVQADFTDLWIPIGASGGGSSFAMIFDFDANIPLTAANAGDVFVAKDTGQFYQGDASIPNSLYQPVFQVQDGVSSYVYIGYNEKAGIEDNFSTVADPLRRFISFQTSQVPIAPIVYGTFQQPWVEYIGAAGAPGTPGTVIPRYKSSAPFVAGAGYVLATFADLTGVGMIAPTINTVNNYAVEIYRDDNPNSNTVVNALSEQAAASAPSVIDIRFDFNTSQVLCDVALAGPFQYSWSIIEYL